MTVTHSTRRELLGLTAAATAGLLMPRRAVASTPPTRIVLAEDLVLYVDPVDGDDATGSTTQPFATIPAAAYHLASRYDLAGHTATIRPVDGAVCELDEHWTLPNVVGATDSGALAETPGKVRLWGNPLNPAAATLRGSGVSPVRSAGVNTVWDVRHLRLEAVNGNVPLVDCTDAQMKVGNLILGTNSGGHIYGQSCVLRIVDKLEVRAGGPFLFRVELGMLRALGVTISIPDNVEFTIATLYGNVESYTYFVNVTWQVAGVVTGRRFRIDYESLALVNPRNLDHIPGSQPGLLRRGGRYGDHKAVD